MPQLDLTVFGLLVFLDDIQFEYHGLRLVSCAMCGKPQTRYDMLTAFHLAYDELVLETIESSRGG